jgi:hypothetical protein
MFAVEKVICPRGELEERGFLFLMIVKTAPRENQHPIKVYQSFYVLAIIAYIPLTPYTNACTLSIPIFIPRVNHIYAVRTYFSSS